ncbi:hypothetical protein [Actinoallomurus sp. NPDC052274]
MRRRQPGHRAGRQQAGPVGLVEPGVQRPDEERRLLMRLEAQLNPENER